MNCFFVHIPKTAGNSIRQMLADSTGMMDYIGKPYKEHRFYIKDSKRPLSRFPTEHFLSYRDLNDYKNSKIKFSVIRNPFDLLVSYYTHNNQRDNGWADVNNYHNFKSFEDFINFYCDKSSEKWHVPMLSKSLYSQLFDEKGECKVTHILYYEDLERHLGKMLKCVGVKNPIRNWHKNKSIMRNGKHYKSFYDKNMIKKVKKKCSWELNTFGYSFDENKNFEILESQGLICKNVCRKPNTKNIMVNR